jgi:PAS domain S-box-containing protein
MKKSSQSPGPAVAGKSRAARAATAPPALKKNSPAAILPKKHTAIEVSRLAESLRETKETLDAILSGEVEAVVVNGPRGHMIYTLAGAEQPYRVYVEQMQEGAVTVSPDGLVLYANRHFAGMIRLPLERVIGSQISDYFSAAAWAKISSVFTRDEKVVKHEGTLQGGDDHEHPVNLTASQLPLPEQNVMCLVVTDLTEQKEKERFRLAKELAEKANEAKDNFLAALSHELRTPLTPVLMLASTMEADPAVPKSVRKNLAMIRYNVELEARLIDDLLDLTRVAHGKMELHLEPLDLHDALHRAIQICQQHIGNKNHDFQVRLNASHSRSQGDPVRLQQALWNLIRNAIKFTPSGGSISIETSNPGPDRFAVQIKDTGIGFDPRLAPKLFEAFEQGSRAITRQFGGLGLGLVISRSIAEAHQGQIHGESPGEGQGATFTLALPLVRPAAPVEDLTTPPVVVKIFTPRKILLVEDHADTRSSLEFLLRKNKHEVLSAGSAGEALELAATHEFDLVISDLGLPDQSGLVLMKKLSADFGLHGIGLSGYGMEEDLVKSRAAGFSHHLIKPVKFEQLKQLIATM